MFPGLLITVIFWLVIVGLALWILSMIPMDPTIAKIIRVVIVVAVCLWLLSLLVGFAPGAIRHPCR